MGNEQSTPSDQSLKPGIYRIVSASAGTAISISSYGYDRVEGWERKEDDSQKWLVQRSGDGYTFNNRKHNTQYIAIGSTDIQSQVYASKFPTTWELLAQGDYYFINKPGNDRVLDLHWGEATNGNKIHIRPRDDKTCKHWKFEYLEEDTTRFMSEHPGADLKLAESQGEIPSKDREISQLRGELSELHTLLYHRDETIRQLEQDVKSKDEALGHAYKMNEEGAYLRKQNSLLEFKLLDQETETGRLQAKMDRVEYLMSQMMSGSDGNASISASTGAMN